MSKINTENSKAIFIINNDAESCIIRKKAMNYKLKCAMKVKNIIEKH